jgi:hypothetical protein
MQCDTKKKYAHFDQQDDYNWPIQLSLSALDGLKKITHCSPGASVAEVEKLKA